MPRPTTSGDRRPARLGRIAVTGAIAAAVLLASACSSNSQRWHGADGTPAPSKPPIVAISLTTPSEGAVDVPPATEISFTTDAVSTTVELADAQGNKVEGAPRPDNSSWLPAQMLKWSTQYTLKVTGTRADGQSETKAATFTTMAKPANTAKASSIVDDGQVVGVGMPIMLSFSSSIPKDQRANVQKRLFVTSEPAQEGVWFWWNDKEVHYRPKEYWKSGTKVSVRAAIGGLALGGDRYGAADLTLNYSIGAKIVMVADNANKQMTVHKDGQLLRTIPVSFGKPTSPTASGHFIIMIKNPSEWFDSATYGVPNNSPEGYRTKVYWPQRLTWDGEYIHAAPWSDADQGHRNVSHGCTNISMAHADWLYKLTHVGDPVIIKGTEERLEWGNGWTDWDRSWEEYVKGSAIPYAPAASQGPSTQPTQSPSQN
jgi:lipoprotein-anchoring transpeptidase ErfK/SrfK